MGALVAKSVVVGSNFFSLAGLPGLGEAASSALTLSASASQEKKCAGGKSFQFHQSQRIQVEPHLALGRAQFAK